MDLLRMIDRFLERTGMPETRFGREAIRDPRLVRDLRQGRTPRAATRARIERFIQGHGA